MNQIAAVQDNGRAGGGHDFQSVAVAHGVEELVLHWAGGVGRNQGVVLPDAGRVGGDGRAETRDKGEAHIAAFAGKTRLEADHFRCRRIDFLVGDECLSRGCRRGIGGQVNARHVETPAAFVKERTHGMRQEIGLATAAEAQIFQTTVDAFEIGETGEQLRFATVGSVTSGTDEAGRTGTDTFDTLGAEAYFFHINAWSKIFGHDSSPSEL